MRPAATAFLAITVGVSAAGTFLAFAPERSGRADFWALACLPSIVLGIVSLFWAKREGLLAVWLAPQWGDFTRGWIGAAAFFGAAWLFVRVIAPVGSPREVWLVSLYGQIGDPRQLRAHALGVGCVVAIAAAGEEIVWRGMVTQLLADRLGSRVAWVWAAGLYGLALLPTAWALGAGSHPNPVLFIAGCAGGLLWGAMARGFGRLVPGILAHAFFDWAVIMMFPLWGGTLILPPLFAILR